MSRSALPAFAMIHFFRPSTSLPISSSNTRSASSASSRVTRLRGPVIALALRRGLELLDRLVPFVVRIGPANLFAQLQPVERWLADVDAAVFHERAEVPIQQGQEQRADVRTVDVGVAEKDRPAVTKLLDVEVVPDPGAERGDERLDLLVA